MKSPRLSKEEKKEGIKYKKILKTHQHWNDWRFKIHWNKLKWVVPKSRNLKKKYFYLFPQVLFKR